MSAPFGLLRFQEQYFERIWGGQRLRTLYGKPIPEDKPIGEAWLISDHPSAVSVVSKGPLTGKTLHDLIEFDAEALLGRPAQLTPHGRFPLLLKLLDSSDVLSVQVHPNDTTAAELGEPDVGKTEMWYVLHADPGAELICGLLPGTTERKCRDAIRDGRLEDYLDHFGVTPGDAVFVEAGTVHAIGKGIVLAEIQQNSDLTYRLYDWSRLDASGKSRQLHVDKGMRATDFSKTRPDLSSINDNCAGAVSQNVTPLVDSRYFKASLLNAAKAQYSANSEVFRIVLCTIGSVDVSCGTSTEILAPGECVFVPACQKDTMISGEGEALLYSL